jgi:hypothetical protein
MTPIQVLTRYLWVTLLSGLFGLACSADVSAFTEIPVRDYKDGAGPSHIFHLHDRVLAVVDPLEGKIVAYKDGRSSQIKEASLPNGSRPWRLVRQPDKVIIISEDEKSRIEVPRDETTWPQQFVAQGNDTADARFRMPRVRRTRSGLVLLAAGGQRALNVKAIGPNYMASMRELERGRGGRRYLLWKEFYFSDESDPRAKKVQVDVYVGRFEKNGSLSGLARIPRASMNRIGFDYVTILPDGTFALLASLNSGKFKIYGGSFERPSTLIARLQQQRGTQHYWAFSPATPTLSAFVVPSDTNVLESGDNATQPVSASRTSTAKAPPTRAEYVAAMDAYRDETWTLTDKNRRSPCEGVVVAGIPMSCPHQRLFVWPPREVKQPYPNPMKGLPYDWGGADSIDEFKKKLELGYVAGNIGDTFWADGAERVTTGVDCSGFVSNVWKLGPHVPTRRLDEFTTPVAELNKMRVGDALLLAGVHVVLYREQVMPDGASLYLRVTEATSRCGSVCDSVYEIDYFHNYTLRRRKPL